MVPNMMSEWPPIYLVAACMLMSTLCSSQRWYSGVAQVLSSITTASRACATSAIARMSGIVEGSRARRLDQHRARIRLEQFFDTGADHWIVVGGLDAIAGEQAVAEIARGPVDVVADQDVVAGLQHREQRRGNRGKARWRETDAGALWAFQLHQHVLQRPRGRRAVPSILVFGAVGVEVFRRRIEHRGAVKHRRIDKTLLRLGIAAGPHQSGFGLLRVRRIVRP